MERITKPINKEVRISIIENPVNAMPFQDLSQQVSDSEEDEFIARIPLPCG